MIYSASPGTRASLGYPPPLDNEGREREPGLLRHQSGHKAPKRLHGERKRTNVLPSNESPIQGSPVPVLGVSTPALPPAFQPNPFWLHVITAARPFSLLTLERSAASPYSEPPPTSPPCTDCDRARQTKKQTQTRLLHLLLGFSFHVRNPSCCPLYKPALSSSSQIFHSSICDYRCLFPAACAPRPRASRKEICLNAPLHTPPPAPPKSFPRYSRT